MSSSSTSSLSIAFPCCISFNFSVTSSCFLASSTRVPYFNWLAFSKSPLLSASSAWCLVFSISSLISLDCLIIFFSLFHWVERVPIFSFKSPNSFSILSHLVLDAASVSFFRACLSISSCLARLSSSSSSAGILSISILKRAVASSIKSIALSGINRSAIYLLAKWAAATNALSFILTPWWISYFSFNPRRIETVSSTITGWNLLSSAASFSIYFLYSSRVVAPMQCSSPLARDGFKIFAASIAPSVAPAPTRVWISSINSIISPFDSFISFKMALSLSSNSPLYFVPAINPPISNTAITLFLRLSGISPLIILCASPSAIAVLPTPGSPINTGLFLVLLDNTCITRLISSSLPITGSSFPFLAASVKLIVYFSRVFILSSGFWSTILLLPLISLIALLIFFSSILLLANIFLKEYPACSTAPKSKCSVETYSSPIFLAISKA